MTDLIDSVEMYLARRSYR